MSRRYLVVAFVVAAVLGTTVHVPASARRSRFPDVIALPTGFRPEGIATGRGATFYVGSVATGAVYRGDLRTGEGSILVAAQPGRAATGLEESRGLLYVAGAATGKTFIYDARTGANVAEVVLTTATPTFINDVVVTRSAAFFTDSVNPVLYRVDRRTHAVITIPLAGELKYEAGFNVNGIDATPNGRTLVLVQSNTGKLFKADPRTGATEEIELAAGESVRNGDGILLAGRTLYVVQNRLNVVATVRLSPRLDSGTVVSRTGNAAFDVPTTIARFRKRLYAVNARFGTPNPESAEYSVVGFRRP